MPQELVCTRKVYSKTDILFLLFSTVRLELEGHFDQTSVSHVLLFRCIRDEFVQFK